MQVGILGINHKLANLKLREMLAKACELRFHPAYSCSGEGSFILLSTCNRTEIYFSSQDLAATHTYLLEVLRKEVKEEFDQKLYSYFGYECFSHLARVTAGLDSACVAETEIQGQVKNAYELAHGLKKLPCDLHYLFQKALFIGKQIRTELKLARGLPDLEDAVFDTAKDYFGSLSTVKILFVGASTINKKIIHHLHMKGLKKVSLFSRSAERASGYREQMDLIECPRLNDWKTFDWIICGTRCSSYLIQEGGIFTPLKTPHGPQRAARR